MGIQTFVSNLETVGSIVSAISDNTDRISKQEQGIKTGTIIGDSFGPITSDSIIIDEGQNILNLINYDIKNSNINYVLHSNANYNTLWTDSQSGTDRAASCRIVFSDGTETDLGSFDPNAKILRLNMDNLSTKVGDNIYLRSIWS